MMFEVLETSWGLLQENLDSAVTLDDLVQAHEAYMEGILARALVNDESTEVKDKVNEVGRCSGLYVRELIPFLLNYILHIVTFRVFFFCGRRCGHA